MIGRTNRIWFACIFAGVPWLCATNSPAQDLPTLALAPADKSEIESLLGPDVVIEALPATPLSAFETYLPKGAPTQSYSVSEVGKAMRSEKHHISAATPGEPTGSQNYEIENVSRNVFVPGENQSLLIGQEYDLDKKVVSTFSPGQPLIIPGLKPGQTQTVNVAVSVADIKDPTDIDYRGKLSITYTLLGKYRVKVPAGTYDADLIKWTYTGDVGPASIKTAEYRFIAPGAGMVAMVEWRSISAVLVYHDKTRLGKMLAGTP